MITVKLDAHDALIVADFFSDVLVALGNASAGTPFLNHRLDAVMNVCEALHAFANDTDAIVHDREGDAS